MPKNSDDLLEASLDLAWSQWVALGVRGNARPSTAAVDPEALLYFTACLAKFDPRLRDEVSDWWHHFGHHVSRARLTALADRFGDTVAGGLTSLTDTFRVSTRAADKSRLDHLSTPARSLLRLRCAFGSNARAEILLEFLTRRDQTDVGLTAVALAEIGYSKRNIAFVLSDLVLSGMLATSKEGNRVHYRLVDPDGLDRLLGPIPRQPGRWHLRLPVLAAFVDLGVRLRGRDSAVQGIEARKLFDELRSNVVAAGATGRPPIAGAETYWAQLQQWLIENLVADSAGSRHGIDGMIEGVWVGPNERPRRPVRASSAVLPASSCNPIDDRELLCLDLVQVATVEPTGDWLWAVLSIAATTTYSHTIGLTAGEEWRFVTWSFGEPRTYAVELSEALPHERIEQAYGPAAAARARTDQPAVQLRLRRLD